MTSPSRALEDSTAHRCRCHSLLLGISMSSVMPLHQDGLWEACAWFPANLSPCTFSLCWFLGSVLSMIVMAMSVNVPRALSPLSQSLNLRVDLGTPTQRAVEVRPQGAVHANPTRG